MFQTVEKPFKRLSDKEIDARKAGSDAVPYFKSHLRTAYKEVVSERYLKLNLLSHIFLLKFGYFQLAFLQKLSVVPGSRHLKIQVF